MDASQAIRLALPLALVALGAGAASDDRLDADEVLQAARPVLLDHAYGHDEMPPPVETRTKAIERELAALGGAHPWAGRYYEGDGLGANVSLLIAPNAGASVAWHGCLGLYGANEGPVVQRPDGTLHLDFNWQNEARRFGSFASDVMPVRWGERRYLVPPRALLAFVNSINLGHEPRNGAHGRFWLRDGDDAVVVDGPPALPADYAALVRTKVVTFDVLDARPVGEPAGGDTCHPAWELTFATGGDRNLRAGVQLRVAEPSNAWADVRVVEIVGSTAVAALELATVPDGACPKRARYHPSRAWKLDTGAADWSRSKPYEEQLE